MKIDVLTLFPEMIEQALSHSIPSRAQKKNLVEINTHHLRDWAVDKHGTVDDTPYGGGAGMILRVDVAVNAFEKVDPKHKAWRIMLTPDGDQFDQKISHDLTQKDHLVLLCGRYEGFDERIKKYVDQKISIGPYVLSGGEIPALAVIDSIVRLIPGVLGNSQSLENETFVEGKTDFPQYTRPDEFQGESVPEVLKSGHHQAVDTWRKDHQQSV